MILSNHEAQRLGRILAEVPRALELLEKTGPVLAALQRKRRSAKDVYDASALSAEIGALIARIDGEGDRVESSG